MVQLNPFIIEGYLSPEYFCDRVEETALLTRALKNLLNSFMSKNNAHM